MDFITKKEEFETLSQKVINIYSNKDLPDSPFEKKYSNYLLTEFDNIFDDQFYKKIIAGTPKNKNEELFFYAIDPTGDYFYKNFKVFNAFRFSSDNPFEEFLNILKRDPGNSDADALVNNLNTFLLFPNSQEWVLYGNRYYEVLLLAFNAGDHGLNLIENFKDFEISKSDYLQHLNKNIFHNNSSDFLSFESKFMNNL